eukprot:CAMPEP_0117508654 /NCGR_PEP_ID=MMETSP0784-20121206/27062_1 /TAXON_ID=39447 /ORGANISM="" /LENGTH=165 /DNA_ID=CAMNT_0005304219 /DNA_START=127 /DNA_END=624 /DNA_ORIENTATION=-
MNSQSSGLDVRPGDDRPGQLAAFFAVPDEVLLRCLGSLPGLAAHCAASMAMQSTQEALTARRRLVATPASRLPALSVPAARSKPGRLREARPPALPGGAAPAAELPAVLAEVRRRRGAGGQAAATALVQERLRRVVSLSAGCEGGDEEKALRDAQKECTLAGDGR